MSFKSRYIEKCRDLGIDPARAVTDQLQPPDAGSGKHSPEPIRETMDLSGQRIDIKTVTALAYALQNDAILTSLFMADSFLGDDGTILIAGALKTNSCLTTLNLRGNNIRADGAQALAQMLKVNTVLTDLLLEWNCVGIWETGVRALADALPINQSLQVLDLRNCKIGVSLDRNKDRRNLSEQSKAHSEHLSSTLQVLSSAHNATMEQLLHKVHETDSKAMSLSEKLARSHRELEDALSGRNRAETMVREMGEEIAKEKTDSTRTISSLQRELVVEREVRFESRAWRVRELCSRGNSLLKRDLLQKRIKVEERMETAVSQANHRALELESSLREMEMKAEVLRRDKVILLEELDKYKERERAVDELHRETVTRMKAAHASQLETLAEAKEKEMASKEKKHEERVKALMENIRTLEEVGSPIFFIIMYLIFSIQEMNALKIKAVADKRHLVEHQGEVESQIRRDEESKRRELEVHLEQARRSRDEHAAELSSLRHTVKQLERDREHEARRAEARRAELEGELRDAKARHEAQAQEVAAAKQRAAELHAAQIGKLELDLSRAREEAARIKSQLTEVEEASKAALLQRDGTIARLRVDLQRCREELEDEVEGQNLRMAELSSQIQNLLASRRIRARSVSPSHA
ncbi:hypothetical protein HK101_005194 [Irineochytrium annulatum]|nr:hypothetical protein HK101_005194 [Irineochytrium annulatum]